MENKETNEAQLSPMAEWIRISRGQSVKVLGYVGVIVGVQKKSGLVHIRIRKTGRTWMFGAEEVRV